MLQPHTGLQEVEGGDLGALAAEAMAETKHRCQGLKLIGRVLQVMANRELVTEQDQ